MKRHVEDFDRDAEAAPLDLVKAAVGETLALKLSEDFGGRRLYVPRKVGVHHPLAVSIGEGPANQVCAVLAQRFVELPLSPAKRSRILILAGEGIARSEIARRLSCTERFVYKVLREDRDARPGDKPQGTLPF